MSDDALERGYEEDLKAEAGYRELWVKWAGGGEQRIRTFPDTEEWREALDRVAFEILEDPEVERVWSLPMGVRPDQASVDLGQRAPGAGGLAGQSDDPRLQAAGRITPSPRSSRLFRRLATETRRVGLDEPVVEEQAGGVLSLRGEGCPAHPAMPVWTCPTCSDRRVQ